MSSSGLELRPALESRRQEKTNPQRREAIVPSAAARLQREEGASRNARMRRVDEMGAVTWIAFFGVDVLVVECLHVGSLGFFLAARVAVLAQMLYGLWRLRDPAMSDRARTAIDVAYHTSAAAAIALMCVPFDGLASPYAPGICLVLIHRTLQAGEQWPRGLAMYAFPALAYPVVTLAAALVDPAIARQFHDTHAVVVFSIHMAFILGTTVMGVVGGHIVWSLRQAIFEARNIGRYKLKRRIGQGATGDVWVAHHAALRRDVAVKILRPDASDEVAISRFEREVHATVELAHPNTVRIFDFGATDDGLWYYAMELLDGETLAELIEREGALDPPRAVHFALQATRALGEAHERGIVHRDIKPSNLFVTTLGGERDFIKVLDFGIARFFQGAGKGDSTLTVEGSILGTPAYISPEAVEGNEVDARADVYAMGAVLYFMLAGRPPFEMADDGPLGLLVAHVNQAPQRPSEKRGSPLPGELESIVMKCLAKAPGDRYADGAALAAALASCRLLPHEAPAN